MKKILKVLCLIVSLLIVVLSVFTAHAVSLYYDGDYTYADIDRYHVSLYDYSGDSDVLVVPEYFTDKMISEIYPYAFENNTTITSIDFSQNPNYVSTIGTKAFAECTGLSGEMTLPSSLRQIGFAAFQGCTGLETLSLNVGLREISEQCFNRCSGLREVYLPAELESINRLSFANCQNLELVYIPSTVTYISPYAFTNSYPVLYVYNESYAHQFAIDNGYDYVIIDPPIEPTEEPTEAPTDEPTQEPTEAPTEEPTQEPTEAPTEAPTESVRYVLGDVDNNGLVETIDSTWIQRYNVLMDLPDTLTISHGDVDGDGDVSLIDATFILRYCIQMDVPYPIGELVES